jgi:hypothetical protein
VTNAIDSGHAATPDFQQLEHATAQGRVLFTYNIGDFFSLHTRLLEEGNAHGGVILAPQQRYSVGEQMRRLLRMSGERSSDEMRNRVEFLSAWE